MLYRMAVLFFFVVLALGGLRVCAAEGIPVQSLKLESGSDWKIADLVLYGPEGLIPYTPLSEWQAEDQARLPVFHLLDGNPETVVERRSLTIGTWLEPVRISGLILRGVDVDPDADTRIDLVGYRAQPIMSIPLSGLDTPKAVYRYDFTTREFTRLKAMPKLPVYRHALHDLRRQFGSKRWTSDELVKMARKFGESQTAEWKDEDGALVLRQGKGGANKGKNYGRFFLKDRDFRPGETISFFFEPEVERYKTNTSHIFQLGPHRFELKNRQYFVDAQGREFVVRTNMAAFPSEFSVNFTRLKDGVLWSVIGPQFDRAGFCKGIDSTSAWDVGFEYQAKFAWTWWNANDQYLDELRLTQISLSRKAMPKIPKAIERPKFNTEVYQGRMHALRRAKPDVPPLVMKRKYGQMTDEEFEAFKATASKMIVPKCNMNNCITFGAGHDLRGIVDVLRMRFDQELLDLVVEWTDSVLANRNGGELCSVNILPAENWNAETIPTRPDFAAPIWPHFMGPRFLNGRYYISQDLTSGASGMAMLTYYAAYVADHPELWNQSVKRASGEELTCRALAVRYVEAVEETLDEFMIPYFIDPDTLRIERPWNRYAQLIEACHLLKGVYAAFPEDFSDGVERADYCDRLVRAYLAYFMDPQENYTVATMDVDGEAVAVAHTEYCAKWRRWGSKDGEDLAHGTMEYGDFYYLFLSGEYPEYLTPAQLRIFADNFHHRMFRGFNEKRQLLICDKFSGLGGNSGLWVPRPVHLWTGIVRPELYDELIDAFIDPPDMQIDLKDYAMILKLREQLWEMGHRGEGASIAPQIRVTVEAQQVAVGEPVRFRGEPATFNSWQWDFDQDGTIDTTGAEAVFTYAKPGIYVATAEAKDPQTGISTFGFKTLIVE